MKTQTLEYNKEIKQITLNDYDNGFLESSIDITDKVMVLALEKLYDEYGLDTGNELCITKKEKPYMNTCTTILDPEHWDRDDI